MSIAVDSLAHPQHSWLQPLLDNKHCPLSIHHSVDSSMVPFYPLSMPEDMQLVVQAIFSADAPRFVGLDSNGDLQVAIQAPSELVVSAIVMLEGAQLPPPPNVC